MKVDPSRRSQKDDGSELSPEVRQMMARARSMDWNNEWRVPTSEHDLSPLAKKMMRTARNDAIIEREKDRLKAKRELFELKKLAARVLIPNRGHQAVEAKTKEAWLADIQKHSTGKALFSVVSIAPSTLLSICAGTKKRAVLTVTRRNNNKENSALDSDFVNSSDAVQEVPVQQPREDEI